MPPALIPLLLIALDLCHFRLRQGLQYFPCLGNTFIPRPRWHFSFPVVADLCGAGQSRHVVRGCVTGLGGLTSSGARDRCLSRFPFQWLAQIRGRYRRIPPPPPPPADNIGPRTWCAPEPQIAPGGTGRSESRLPGRRDSY